MRRNNINHEDFIAEILTLEVKIAHETQLLISISY